MRNRGPRAVRVAATDDGGMPGSYALQVLARLESNARLRSRLLAVDPARFWLAASGMHSAGNTLDVAAVLDRAETVPLAWLEGEARARTQRLNERLRLKRAEDHRRDAAGIITLGAPE